MRILIGVVAALVLAVIGATIWIGASSYERTVVSDPYEAGLRHDHDRHRAEQLGWTFTIDESSLRAGPESTVDVRLATKEGAPLGDAMVTVRVARPGTVRFDRSAEALPHGGGRYVAVLPMPEPGFWDLDLVVRKGQETLTLERWIHVGGGVGEGPHCDVGRRACRAATGDVVVVLELAPHPPVPLAEMRAAVQVLRGAAPVDGAAVSVELSMPGMFMGENRVVLGADGGGRYAGTGALVRCASGRHDWVAEVVARLPGGGEARARFPFQAAE